MNSIHKTRAVELRAWEEIKGLLSELSNGQLEPKFHDSGAQSDGFDVTSHCWLYSNGARANLECKAEEKYTGNLFIETWSNKAFGLQKAGWSVTIKADWLLYYFLDQKAIYIIPMRKLWDWFYGSEAKTAAFVAYREVLQKRHDQLNKTWGRLVPIGHVYYHVKFYEFRHVNGGWEQHADMYCDDKQKYQNLPRDWNHDLNYQTENQFTVPKRT